MKPRISNSESMKTIAALGLVVLCLCVTLMVRYETGRNSVAGVSGAPITVAVRTNQDSAIDPGSPSIWSAGTPSPFAPTAVPMAADIEDDRRKQGALHTAAAVAANQGNVLGSFTGDPECIGGLLYQLQVRRWAEENASAAAVWVTQLPDAPLRKSLLEQVAIAWANLDLPAAVGWVRTLPSSDSQMTATRAVAYETARSDPIAALDLAATLPPSRERDDLLVHAVSQWAACDASSATAWAKRVSETSLRQRLVAATAIGLAERDGFAAAKLSVSDLEAGTEQDRAVVAIVQRWTQQSPEAAASWVSEFPDGPLRKPAAEILSTVWREKDPLAAAKWLGEFPSEPACQSAAIAELDGPADGEQREAGSALKPPQGAP